MREKMRFDDDSLFFFVFFLFGSVLFRFESFLSSLYVSIPYIHAYLTTHVYFS